MKISWNCLNQIIDLKYLNIKDVTNKLTLAGFEVENITKDIETHDTFFDINITANRQDIIGFIHIAIELSALFNIPMKIHKNTKDLNNNTHLKECCYIIKNVQIHKSDHNITTYLHKFNFKITYTILDVIHFINLKWGQKIKIYQLKTLQKKEISKYSIKTRINIRDKEEVYINDKKINEITINNINNEENITYLLLINHNNLNLLNRYSSFAYQEICKILDKPHQKLLIPYIQTYNNKQKKYINKIICKIDKIQYILGPIRKSQNKPLLDINNIIQILEKLNFRITNSRDQLQIEIPKEREHDIYNDIDIIEEIGRIYGFNNFIDNLPKFQRITSTTYTSHLDQKIRRILRSTGLHEVINYPLQGVQDNKKCLIINPLNQYQSILRNNLIENIISSKLHNIHQGNEPFEVFELGAIFNQQTMNKEYKHLCCLMGNNYFNQSTWDNNKSQLTWSQAKGYIEDLFEKINAQVEWSIKKDNNRFINNLQKYIHPTRYIYISHKNTTIGILSQLNHRINNLINPTYNTYFFEIDIIKLSETIISNHHLKYRYLPCAIYPKITRDLSIKINKRLFIQQVFDTINDIKKETNQIIESVKVQNEYCNNKQTKTICLRVTYRSPCKTLTNEEVEILDNIFKKKIMAL